MAVQRGCGYRLKGSIYSVLETSRNGRPLADFLIDPPFILDDETRFTWGITESGVRLVRGVDGVWHIFDIVGQENYPNVADVIEEARHFGFSRRLARNLQWEKLTSRSTHFLFHARAHFNNWQEMHTAFRCPKFRVNHMAHLERAENLPEMCLGLVWEDVSDNEIDNFGRDFLRVMPSLSYAARSRPKGFTPMYATAAFAAFPVRLQVISDPADPDFSSELVDAIRGKAPEIPIEEVED